MWYDVANLRGITQDRFREMSAKVKVHYSILMSTFCWPCHAQRDFAKVYESRQDFLMKCISIKWWLP